MPGMAVGLHYLIGGGGWGVCVGYLFHRVVNDGRDRQSKTL